MRFSRCNGADFLFRFILAAAIIVGLFFAAAILGSSLAHGAVLMRYPLQGKELAQTQVEINNYHLDFKVVSGYVLTTDLLIKQKTCIVCVVVKKGLNFFEVQFFKWRNKIIKTRTATPAIGEIRDLLRENI